MKRYDPGIQFAVAAIEIGQIGKIQSVSCWYRLMAALRPVEATLFPVIDETVRQRETALKEANREKHLLTTHGNAHVPHHRRARLHFIQITMLVAPAKRPALRIARSPCLFSLATSSA
jgi:hypothetical protein